MISGTNLPAASSDGLPSLHCGNDQCGCHRRSAQLIDPDISRVGVSAEVEAGAGGLDTLMRTFWIGELKGKSFAGGLTGTAASVPGRFFHKLRKIAASVMSIIASISVRPLGKPDGVFRLNYVRHHRVRHVQPGSWGHLVQTGCHVEASL